MGSLMAGEDEQRQWFALDVTDLTALGDCGDYNAAAEIARDLGLETCYLVSPFKAQEWANTLADRGITGD